MQYTCTSARNDTRFDQAQDDFLFQVATLEQLHGSSYFGVKAHQLQGLHAQSMTDVRALCSVGRIAVHLGQKCELVYWKHYAYMPGVVKRLNF